MTKEEMLQFLQPFTDDIRICARTLESPSRIAYVARPTYRMTPDGEGLVVLEMEEPRSTAEVVLR